MGIAMSRSRASNIWTSDVYSSMAKEAGYSARSVFKLEEIQSRFQIFLPEQNVIDLGCYPGSWTRYIAQQVGPRGRVVGIDQMKMPESMLRKSFLSEAEAPIKTVQADILKWEPPFELYSKFDVLTSDLAPATTGNKDMDREASVRLCLRALSLGFRLLNSAEQSLIVLKVFQGKEFGKLYKILKLGCIEAHAFKPVSSRVQSVETFVVLRGWKPILLQLIEEFENIPQDEILRWTRSNLVDS